MREDHEQLVELKTEVHRLHAVEHTYKVATDRISELELIIVQLRKELEGKQQEIESAVNEKEAIKKDSELVGKASASIACSFLSVTN